MIRVFTYSNSVGLLSECIRGLGRQSLLAQDLIHSTERRQQIHQIDERLETKNTDRMLTFSLLTCAENADSA